MNAAIASASLDDLKAYLTWNLVRDSSNALSLPFEQESFNFYGKVLRGAKEMRPRWKRCVDLTDQQLPDALGRKFVETTWARKACGAPMKWSGRSRKRWRRISRPRLDDAPNQATGDREAARRSQ